ncbi:Transposon Ty3-I Gag-Pol poly [Paramuricea clavata]|uniref:Transposon Ty3-I Gag-Pol poly n=1 Tax=Paramuricea clavata TaxID=317549 RepID=A0A7D9ISR5_PARCT|nr:Transposon Ty3-I Gag-Pol poly [Paramuricea clavata]
MIQEIEEATKADATLQAVSKAIETGNWQEGPKQSDVVSVAYTAWQKVKEELTVGVTAQIILRGTRIAVPRKLQERIVNLAHEGHQGVVKTKSLLREKVWFPGIDKLVEKKVQSCCVCLISTPESKCEPLKMSPLPKAPWSEVSMDFVELPNSEYQDIRSSKQSSLLQPTRCEFQLFAQTLGFKHRKITPRWPRANGEVEQFVRTIKKVVKTATVEHKNWKQEMHCFLRNFRATPHTTTKIHPATALSGRALKTKLP